MWEIDKYARMPIYEQVVDLVERYVLHGILKEDEKMPSVRTLSQTLNINPNTLQKAYAELERRGVCYAVPGSGRFVCTEARGKLLERKKEQLTDFRLLAGELYDAGISVDEMVDCIRAAAQEAEANAQTKRNTASDGADRQSQNDNGAEKNTDGGDDI